MQYEINKVEIQVSNDGLCWMRYESDSFKKFSSYRHIRIIEKPVKKYQVLYKFMRDSGNYSYETTAGRYENEKEFKEEGWVEDHVLFIKLLIDD